VFWETLISITKCWVQGRGGFSKLHWLKLGSGAGNPRHTGNQQSTLKSKMFPHTQRF